MLKKLPTYSVIFALILGSLTPTTAAANDERLGQFLFGAMSLFILGKALEDGRSNSHATPPPRQHQPRAQFPRNRILPAQCVRRINTEDGRRRFLAQRCLNRHAPQAARLPRACKTAFTNRNGRARGYYVGCLKRRGFRIQ